LRDQIVLSKQKKHNIEVLVDFIDLLDFKSDAKGSRERLAESLERALHEADGLVIVAMGPNSAGGAVGKNDETLMSSKFSCPNDGFAYPEMWEKQQVSISHPIKSGDRVLLCSDGITGDFGEDKLSLEEIEYCLKSGSPSDSAEFLTKVARKQDDRTSVVFDVQ